MNDIVILSFLMELCKTTGSTDVSVAQLSKELNLSPRSINYSIDRLLENDILFKYTYNQKNAKGQIFKVRQLSVNISMLDFLLIDAVQRG